MSNDPIDKKDTKEVLGDYFKEVLGYDNGLFRTIIDLYRNPTIVLKSYLEKEHKYISPFRILITALTFWVLVNSYFLDWYKTAENNLRNGTQWIERNFEESQQDKGDDREEKEMFETKFLPRIAKFIGDLYSKYFVAGVIIYLPILSFFTSIRGQRYGADFKALLAALSYSYSINILFFFTLSLFAYFNMLHVFFILCIPLAVLQLTGKTKLGSFTSIRRFFFENGKEIERELMIVVSVIIVSILPPLIFWLMKY